MKKNFVKKLALGLALVMAVTSVPASSEAAAAPGFKSDAVKVRVGQTKKYSTENSKKYSVKFKIGNKKVATIKYTAGSKSVKVTGVAEGKTTLRADFKSYSTKKVTTAKVPVTVLAAKEEAPVVTAPELATVTQKAANVVELGFTADASAKFTAENVKIESADGTYTLAVKSLEFSTDGKGAIVTTYGNLVDKTVFDVTCGEKTVSFTASVGDVKRAVINTVQAEANVRTPIKFTLYDANNIDVTAAAQIDKYASIYVDGDYYEVNTTVPSKANLTLANVDGTVTVTLVYDPVSATGELIQVEGVITCVNTQQSVGKTSYFTKGKTHGTAAPKIYLNSFVEDTVIYADDSTVPFYFTALDANGDAIAYDSYTFESSNEDVITVNDDYVDSKLAVVQVTPQGVGTAKVVITAVKNDIKTVYAKTVVVNAERRLATIQLDKSSLAITAISGTSQYVNDNDKVTVTLKDQYGKVMTDADLSVNITADQYNGKGEVVVADVKAVAGRNGAMAEVYVEDAMAVPGNYIVAVEATDGEYTLVKKFSVSVREVNSSLAPTYRIELDNKAVDYNPEVMMETGVMDVTVKVAEYFGTVFAGYVTADDASATYNNVSTNKVEYIAVKNSGKYFMSQNLANITTSAVTTTAVSGDFGASLDVATAGAVLSPISGAGVNLVTSADNDAAACVAKTGTYTVTAVITSGAVAATNVRAISKPVSATANFTIANTAEMPKVTVDSTTGEGFTAEEVIEDCITVDVAVLGDEKDSIVGVYGKDMVHPVDLDASNKVVVKYVAITDTFYGMPFTYYVPVSRTFRAK